MKKVNKESLAHEAVRLVSQLQRGAHATVVALSGELGAGKTTFTQEVAKVLGVEDHVVSPTFVIQKIYALKNQKFEHLIHIDAYRLESAKELEHLGWHDIVANSSNLILIEWPERVAELIPAYAIRITLSHGTKDEERYMEVLE